jgi:hypothetical protein
MRKLLAGLVLGLALAACGGKAERNGSPAEAPIPTVQHATLHSTAIQSATYYSEDDALVVQFTSGPRTYVYCGVPQSVFDGLDSAKSAGTYFADNIADQYDTATFSGSGWAC